MVSHLPLFQLSLLGFCSAIQRNVNCPTASALMNKTLTPLQSAARTIQPRLHLRSEARRCNPKHVATSCVPPDTVP